jgi:hypothetical protein
MHAKYNCVNCTVYTFTISFVFTFAQRCTIRTGIDCYITCMYSTPNPDGLVANMTSLLFIEKN